MTTLTERAHGATVEKRDDTLQGQIRQMEAQFQLAMPRGVEASQLVRDALTALRQTPDLAECDARSVLGGLMTCAQLGLRVGVLGHAWLLPFYDRKSRSKKATLVVGYQGLIDLAYRSDRVAGITARVVYENDPVWDVEYGTEDRLIHKPLMTGPRGKPIAYYAVCHIKDGRPLFFPMSHEEMEEYRDRYATAKNREGQVVGPWRDNFEGMALKTCIRQLSKSMPKSTEFSTALMADNGVRVDVTPTADVTAVTHHYDDTIEGEIVEDTEAQVAANDPALGGA